MLEMINTETKKDKTEISFKTEKGEEVKTEKQIKILGWWWNGRRSMDTHLMKTMKKVNYRIHIFNNLSKFMNEKTRSKYIHSKITSLLSYGISFYLGQNQKLLTRIQTEIMKLARLVKQSACFKIRRSIICHSINWEEPTQWMMKSAIMFIHKTLFHKEPKQVLHEYRLPRTRSTALLSTSTAPKTAIFENTLIFKALTLFNALPDELKTLTPHQLKLKFKKFDVIQPKQLSGVSCKGQPQTLQR